MTSLGLKPAGEMKPPLPPTLGLLVPRVCGHVVIGGRKKGESGSWHATCSATGCFVRLGMSPHLSAAQLPLWKREELALPGVLDLQSLARL